MNDKSALIRQVNDGIGLVAEDFTRDDPGDPTTWSFLCECGDGECAEWVPLELASFRALRANAKSAVLADGHVQRARAARAAAQGLADDAAALRAQAGHQVGRARRLQHPD